MGWTNRIIGSDKMVYLDYAAATPTDEEVLNEFVKATKNTMQIQIQIIS